ncbi:MAG TPA: NAD(P)/FAD-dependent oxidoreductase [Candidatus Saccharibacteria bacterium]|nr:NAD(P)/FAD-dependent oxidoreductase [Candidatus Saccharibacteria bacterium]HRQ07071.1 NAD(P)/FAD-dependent oxidoreductase [Candidatus Saccharibacteria bacterium]
MEKDILGPLPNNRTEIIKQYNIAIIGGGPAGIAAGIYSKYDGNNPIIFERRTLAWIPENHINLLGKLEGLPGLLNTVDGTQLVEKFRHSLSEMEVEYHENSEVADIRTSNTGFVVQAKNMLYQVQALIIATGTNPKKLSPTIVNGFDGYIHYFALNLYGHYVSKKVVVLGSRNSGSTAAIYLARHGVKVTILEIKSEAQAKEKHTKHFAPLGIRVITGAEVKLLNGKNGKLRSVNYIKDNKEYSLDCVAVFCYIGVTPENTIANNLGVSLDDTGYAKTDFFQSTNIPGIFIAGDVCGDLKHIVAANGQGAKAAYNVNKYLLAKGETPSGK